MKVSHQLPAPARSSRKPPIARRLLVLALALGAVPAAAQRVPGGRGNRPAAPALVPADTVRQVVELPPATLDSLAAEPLLEPVVDSARLAWLLTPPTFSELVGDRMSCIETTAPHQFNAAVLAYVRLFTERKRAYTQRVLEREQFYFPIFEKYLAQYNLPAELKYLSVVESALIPTAKSPVGAVGLWQFMPPTAGDLRLKRDEWVDERMHPEKATEAACKHLRYLYGIFHDWELVLAAYNWGAGNMQRVIRRTGKHNFWELYPHLPAETRNYVPTFTAIMYAMKYAPEHSLRDASLHYQAYEPLDTLGVRGQALDLRRLSRALGYADSLALSRYNPELRHGALPVGYRPYVLRYPSTAREHLGEVDRATLLAYCQPTSELPMPLAGRPVRLAGVEPWLASGLATAADLHADEAAKTVRYRRVHYTVRRGQTVATLAEKFEVSAAQLRRWNDLGKSTTLRPGRQLVVLVPLPGASAPATSLLAPAASQVARQLAAADSAAGALTAANARYARAAQAATLREAAQGQELLRLQKQQAARIAAQQRQAIFRAAALAKAAAAEEKARQLAAATEASHQDDPTAVATAAAPATPTTSPDTTLANTARYDRAKTTASREPAVIAPLAKTPSLAISSHSELYTVQPGDNLSALAAERGVSLVQVKEWNHLATERVLAGQRLRFSVPAGAVAHARPASTLLPVHVVQQGDTLFNISRRFKVSVQELRRLNHLKSDDVKLGQKLVVQAG